MDNNTQEPIDTEIRYVNCVKEDANDPDSVVSVCSMCWSGD